MMLALGCLGILSLFELLLWLPPIWNIHKMAARGLMPLLLLATAALLFERPAVWTVLLAILSIYRGVNLVRIAIGRIQADYLYHASRQSALWLISAQAGIAAAAGFNYRYDINPVLWWTALVALQIICAAVVTASTLRHLRTTKKPALKNTLRDSELPALTVAIPARNETSDLEACLRSLAASTYPKLEIIVLDDCSQDKRTPEIIREFAHDGVQFIAGTQPTDGWLAKNHAYAQLAAAANGELLLFCGVDVRFQPGSLTTLVQTLSQKHKAMISVLPRNLKPESRSLRSWFIQPSRYAWERALPRRLLRRPPVLSTCWLIRREALEAAGGFQAVRRKGVPESYLARVTAGMNDGYGFLQSDSDIGVISQKSIDEQKATAIRTRYLQLHRRPELTALIGLAELTILVWPLVISIVSLLVGQWALTAASGLSYAMMAFVYAKLVNLTYRSFTLKGVWLLPLAVLYDIGLLNYSMWQYEFREVLWKGRNICIPIMRAIPELPKI